VKLLKVSNKAIKKTAIISSMIGIVFLVFSIIVSYESSNLDYMVVIAFTIAVTPTAIVATVRNRWKNKIEKAVPEFLRDLSTACLVGMPLQTALEHTAQRHYGPFTDELKQLVAQMSWGMTFNEALLELSKRIDLPIIKKASVLITEAGRHGGKLAEIFESTAKYVESVNSWNTKRRNQTLPYVAIFYFSVLIYLFIIILISTMLFVRMSAISAEGSQLIKPILTGLQSQRLFLHTALLEALFGGLMAGKINEDSFAAGLRHTAVLAVVSGLAFYLFFH
jgi:flagellar protein FlaJ